MHIESSSQQKISIIKILVLLTAISIVLISITRFDTNGMRSSLAVDTAVQVEQTSTNKTPTPATTPPPQTPPTHTTSNFIWITISTLILIVFAIHKYQRRKASTW